MEKPEAAHLQLDAQLGAAGDLRKITTAALKKQVVDISGDAELAALMAREAIVDSLGNVDVPATIFKFKRRNFYKSATAADSALLKPQWADPGNSDTAPKGSGPPPTKPGMQDNPDLGNAGVRAAAVPISVIGSDGLLHTPGGDRPDLAIEILRDLIRRTRRAQGL